jgi:UDP-GlcNAc:undecaprenyl-phosphate/decaprenyl-phosphate GlcNAc-1-phosphate transferase
MNVFLVATLVGACVFTVVVLANFGGGLCRSLQLLDYPNERKLHKNPTPLLGGLALILAYAPAALIYTLVRPLGDAATGWIFVVAPLAMALIGLADDRHSLSPRLRIILSFFVFGMVSAADPNFLVRSLGFNNLGIEIGLLNKPLAVLFTTVCCVGLVNAVNMADGKNGLVIGLCLGWLAILTMRAPENLQPYIILLVATLIILFIYNMQGKLFLGDGGAYGFASVIGLLTIMVYNCPDKFHVRLITAEEVILLFGVPVLDSFRLTVKRLREGRSPASPDRDHLHHLLMDRFGWPGGLAVYVAVAILPAAAIIALR